MSMRARESSNGKAELLANLKWSLEVSRKIVDLDNKLYKIYKKPIKLGFLGHFYLFMFYGMITAGAMFYLDFNNGVFDYFTEDQSADIRMGVFLAYPFLIFFINRYIMMCKRFINNPDIKMMQKQRPKLVSELAKTTVVPKDYWNIQYFSLLIKYIENKRADNLKEALNLLAEDIRHEETLSQLGAIQEDLSRPRFFVAYPIE